MYVVYNVTTGLYFQWKSIDGGDWRGQWLVKHKASVYPKRTAFQLSAIQSMFPEFELVWRKL